MLKINPLRFDKVWGYELWLSSPLAPFQTIYENGMLTIDGPLVKIIVADEALSVQVHPDDTLAAQLTSTNARGKDESWYVINAAPQASAVLGLKACTQAQLVKAIATKKLDTLLIKKRLRTGDFVNIPAGLVHALGGGLSVLEVQTPSNETYRLDDYERVTNGVKRELHIAEALLAIKMLNAKIDPIALNPLTYQTRPGTISLHEHPYFVNERAIVVDIANEQAYLAHQEWINYARFAVITWSATEKISTTT